MSKVLERIVLKQFLQHLQSHSFLEPFQSAYRKCHSTETALLRVVNDLLQAPDCGCVSILSLLDLSAAFDTTDHNILIARLRSTFGSSGTVLDWFTNTDIKGGSMTADGNDDTDDDGGEDYDNDNTFDNNADTDDVSHISVVVFVITLIIFFFFFLS